MNLLYFDWRWEEEEEDIDEEKEEAELWQYQCDVHQLYQSSTGHKGISQVSDGLNHILDLQKKNQHEKKI